MFRFREMKVYQDALAFHRAIVLITARFPREYLYLTDQVRRSALSVALNIAEGSAKGSDKDFNRYLHISLGSINESMAACDVAQREGLLAQEEFNALEARAGELSKQLGGFSKALQITRSRA